MEAWYEPIAGGGLQDPARLVVREDAGLAEDVAETRPSVGGDTGQLVLDDGAHVGLRATRSAPEFGRDRMRAEEGRHHVDRTLDPQAMGRLQQADLGLQVQPVARLRLDRRHPVAQHLIEPAPAVSQQRVRRGRPGRRHRRQDPAACLQDLEVPGTTLAQEQFAFARPGEQQVRVRIDEAGGDRPAGRVQTCESAEGIALGLECRLERRPWPDRGDTTLPARDDRGVGGVGPAGVRGGQSADIALARTHPNATGQCHDLGRPDDQKPGRRFISSTAEDEPEWAAAHRGSLPPRADSRRSSSACIGEKSRRRR